MMAGQPPSSHDTSRGRLPAGHKKRFWIVLGVYLAMLALAGGFILAKGEKTRETWSSRIPHAELAISSTPDNTEDAANESYTPASSAADTLMAPEEATNASLAIPPGTRKPAYVSIIITNAGISSTDTEKAFSDLPVDIAFAFSPYAQGLGDWVKKSTLSKRDMLLLIPMEPFDYPKQDPGPQTLLTRLGLRENEENLKNILARVPEKSVIGVMNDAGGRFLADAKSLLPIFSILMTKNIFFIENGENDIPQATSTAAIAGLPYTTADIKIDRTIENDAVLRQRLADLEKTAQDKGSAIGIAEPYPISIRVVKEWADSLDSRGIRLVPLTTVLNERMRQKPDDQPQEPVTAP